MMLSLLARSRPRGLAYRVGAAAAVATLVVMMGFAVLLHHQMKAEIRVWERSEISALAQHLSAMLESEPEGQRARILEQLGSPLSEFGVSARLVPAGEAPGPGVRVHLDDDTAVEVRTKDAGDRLVARLAPLYLGLTGGVLLALLLAVQGSIYWGLSRPLRAVERQIAQMHRGRWWAPARGRGVAEVAQLASGLEALGQDLELKIGQWAEAERRAGFELCRNRLRLASLELRRELLLLVGDLLAREELSRQARRNLRRLQRTVEELGTQFSRPLEDLGLGPPEWDRLARRLSSTSPAGEPERASGEIPS